MHYLTPGSFKAVYAAQKGSVISNFKASCMLFWSGFKGFYSLRAKTNRD